MANYPLAAPPARAKGAMEKMLKWKYNTVSVASRLGAGPRRPCRRIPEKFTAKPNQGGYDLGCKSKNPKGWCVSPTAAAKVFARNLQKMSKSATFFNVRVSGCVCVRLLCIEDCSPGLSFPRRQATSIKSGKHPRPAWAWPKVSWSDTLGCAATIWQRTSRNACRGRAMGKPTMKLPTSGTPRNSRVAAARPISSLLSGWAGCRGGAGGGDFGFFLFGGCPDAYFCANTR